MSHIMENNQDDGHGSDMNTDQAGTHPFKELVLDEKQEQDARYHIVRDSKGSKYLCKDCEKKFKSWSNFKKHLKIAHDKTIEEEEEQIKCISCEEKFSTVEDLQKHVMTHKTESEHFSCALCGEKFLRQSQLAQHMCHLLDSNMLPLNIRKGSKHRPCEVNDTHCPICNKLYSVKSSWQKHMTVHLGQQKHKCSVCSRAFRGRRELRNHMTFHTGELPFKCAWCPKRCNSKSNMSIHEKTHAAVYYLCCRCGKEFAKKRDLLGHECKANEASALDVDMKFLCNVCNINCGSMSAMKEHILTHKYTHRYVCPRCNIGFRFKQELHMHHKKKRPLFQCRVCLRGFSTQDKLEAHERRNVHSQHGALQKRAPTLKKGEMKKTETGRTLEEVLLMKDCQHDDAGNTKKPEDDPTQVPIKIDNLRDPQEETELNKMLDAADHYIVKDSKGSKYACNKCRKKFVSRGNFKKHMQEAHDKTLGEEQIKCSICKEKFSTVGDLQEHVMIHKTESEHYSCALCGEKFLRQSQLSHHKCHLLSSKLSSIKKGSKHRIWQIGDVNDTHCPICNKLYSVRWSWQNHMTIHLGQQKHKCQVCFKAFSGKRELTIHMTLHSGERPFKCSWCPKRCSSKSNMAIHEKTHAHVYHLCCLCGEKFKQKKFISTHKCGAELNGSQEGDRKFSCNVCGNNYPSVSILKRHVVSHGDTHPHVCLRCGQGFKLQQDLMDHNKIKRPPAECVGDYSYQCTVCSKKFLSKTQLKTHERNERYKKQKSQWKRNQSRQNDVTDKAAETPDSERYVRDNKDMDTVSLNEDCDDDQRLDTNNITSQLRMHSLQEYPCFLCDKKLPTEMKLKSHLKVHTGVKPYKCSKCGKRFDFPSGLKKHKRSHKKKR